MHALLARPFICTHSLACSLNFWRSLTFQRKRDGEDILDYNMKLALVAAQELIKPKINLNTYFVCWQCWAPCWLMVLSRATSWNPVSQVPSLDHSTKSHLAAWATQTLLRCLASFGHSWVLISWFASNSLSRERSGLASRCNKKNTPVAYDAKAWL